MRKNHRKLFFPTLSETTPIDEICASGICDSSNCPYNCYPYPDVFKISPPPRSPNPPPPPSPPPLISDVDPGSNGLSLYVIIIIVAVGASLVLLGTFYLAAKCTAHWLGARNGGNQQARPRGGDAEEFLDQNQVDHPIWFIRTIGLQPSVISSIAVWRYKKGEGLIEGTDCSVCLNEFQDDETLRILPRCNHAFHISCIDTWLTSHTNCPLCRAQIISGSSSPDDSTPVVAIPDNTAIRMENPEVNAESEQNQERIIDGTESRVGSERENEDRKEEIGINDSVNQPSYPDLDAQMEDSETDGESDHNRTRNVDNNQELVSDNDPTMHLSSNVNIQMENSSDPNAEGSDREDQPDNMAETEKEVGSTVLEEPEVIYDYQKGIQIEKMSGSSDKSKNYIESHSGILSNRLKITSRYSTLQLLHKNPVAMKRSASCPRRLFSSRYYRSPNSIIPM